MRMRVCLYMLLISALTQGQLLAAEPRYDFRIVIDVSGSMSVSDQRKQPEDIVEAAAALGMLPLSETTDANRAAMALDAKQRQTIAAASRLDLARSLLSKSARTMLESIGDERDPQPSEGARDLGR